MSTNTLGPEWHVTPEGLNLLTESSSIKDNRVIHKTALDTDIKEFGAPILKDFLSNHTKTVQKCVLQIQKVRNISAPKANEGSQAAPRMLKLTLTDGDSYIQAIELSTIPSISRDKTAPGTKVLININKIVSGYLLLSASNCTVLGGKVAHMHEKWELAKSIQQTRQISSSGAPPWVNFGSKIQATNQDGSFKSLSAKQKENKDNAEFEQLRQEAIAEAASGAVKKTFGGRVKQNLQPAMTQPQKRNYEGRERKGGKIRTGFKEVESDERPLKPSEKVSLFAFLEDKLPTNEVKSNESTKSAYQKQQHYQNHEKNYPVLSNSTQNAQKSQPNHSFSNNDKRPQSNRDRSDGSQYQNKNTYPSNTYNRPQSDKDRSDNISQHQNKNIYPSNNDNRPQSNRDRSDNVSQYQNKNTYPSNNESRPQSTRDPSDISHQNKNSYPNNKQNNYYGNQQTSATYGQNNVVQSHSRNPSFVSNTPRYQQQNNFYQQNPYNSYNYQKPQDNNYTTHNSYNNGSQRSHDRNVVSQPKQEPSLKPIKVQQQSQNTNNQVNKSVDNLADGVAKISVNNEFASRSLRQHLNLNALPRRTEETNRKNAEGNAASLNLGDECMAKYWEDGKFYNAIITAMTDKTYAVQFKGYGNIEEVLKTDCYFAKQSNYHENRNQNNSRPHSGSMEFRRTPRK